MSQQTAASAVLVKQHASKSTAVDMRDAIVFCEPLIQICVVCFQKFNHAAVFAHDALEKQLGFAPECLPQIIVKVGIQPGIWSDRIQISQVKPLGGKVADQRAGAFVGQHASRLLFQHRGLT